MIAITVHSAGMLQAKQLTTPPISRQLSKDFLNPLPPLGMPLDMALPTSGPRPSSTHQWAGKGPALQENFISLWTASPTRGQNARKPQSCRLWTQPVQSRWHPVLGPAGPQPCLLAGQYKLQDTPDSVPTVSGTTPYPTLHQWSDTNSEYLGPAARLQGMALPAGHLALTPGPGFTPQRVGNSLGVLWTLAMPTSEPALATGPLGFCSQLPVTRSH